MRIGVIQDSHESATACPKCERLRLEYERAERVYASAAAALRARVGSGADNYIQLEGMVLGEYFDMNVAVLRMKRHLRHCAIRRDVTADQKSSQLTAKVSSAPRIEAALVTQTDRAHSTPSKPHSWHAVTTATAVSLTHALLPSSAQLSSRENGSPAAPITHTTLW